jgi:hypothetical protein
VLSRCKHDTSQLELYSLCCEVLGSHGCYKCLVESGIAVQTFRSSRYCRHRDRDGSRHELPHPKFLKNHKLKRRRI